MKKIFLLIKLETKRDLNIILVSFAILFLSVAIILNQFGIDQFKKNEKEISDFIGTEKQRNLNYVNVFEIKSSGICITAMKTCLFPLFYNSTPIKDIVVFFDGMVRFNINCPQKGSNVYSQPLGVISMDFNWFFLFLGSAAFLILGFLTYHKKEEYVKFLLGFANHRTAHSAVLASKILIIIGFLVVSFIAVLIQYHVFNGIRLSGVELRNLSVFFFVLCFIIYLFSLSLGIIFGKFKSTFKGVSLSIIAWFFLIIFIPEIFNVTLAKNTKSMFDSIYSHELKKLEIFSQAEKSIFEEVSKYKTPEEIKRAYKRMIQQYLDGDFKKIVALEENMLKNTVKAAEKVHFWSIFTPVTFYKSAGNEISGYSYNGLIAFYKANISQYEKFVKYCLENTMIRMRPKDNPFIKNPEDYVVHLESSLPKYFGSGILLNCFFLLILIGISYFRFTRFIYPKPENKEAFKELDFKYTYGKHISYFCKNKDFSNQVFNVFLGMGKARKYSGKISIDGNDIVTNEKQDFVYLPNQDVMPQNIKTKSFLDFACKLLKIPGSETNKIKEESAKIMDKRFADLKDLEKVELMLKIATLKKSKIYIFNNFSLYFPPKILKKIFEGLKDKLIVEFTSVSLMHSNYYYYSVITLEDSLYEEDKMGI